MVSREAPSPSRLDYYLEIYLYYFCITIFSSFARQSLVFVHVHGPKHNLNGRHRRESSSSKSILLHAHKKARVTKIKSKVYNAKDEGGPLKTRHPRAHMHSTINLERVNKQTSENRKRRKTKDGARKRELRTPRANHSRYRDAALLCLKIKVRWLVTD